MELPSKQSSVVVVLLTCTLLVSINVYDVFSMFYLIAQEFNDDVSLLGVIVAAMIVGIGTALIPGGILAAKYGPKVAALVGMVLVGGSSLATSLSFGINEIIVLRFVLGAGLAFYLPSVIVLITEHVRKESQALGVGAITGSNAAGGIIGLVVWIVIAQTFGWKYGMGLGGAIALVAALPLYLLLPKTSTMTNFRIKPAHIRSLLSDKKLISLGLMLLGSQAIFEQTMSFMPFYLQSQLAVDPPIAGVIGSIILVASLVGAPTVGWLHDKKLGFSRVVLILGVILFLGVSINAFLNLTAALISVLLVGFAGAGLFTVLSNSARLRSLDATAGAPPEYSTLSVNWVHAIAVTGTLWAPLLLSSTALNSGFQIAWPIIGSLSVGIILLVLFLGYNKQITPIAAEHEKNEK